MLPVWIRKFESIEKYLSEQIGKEIKIRSSDDATGNLKNGGNWIQESDNVNISEIYFEKEKLKKYKGLLESFGSYHGFKQNHAQPFFRDGKYSGRWDQKKALYCATNTIVLLTVTGSTWTRGAMTYGPPAAVKQWTISGDTSGVAIKQMWTSQHAFYALTYDNDLYWWGSFTSENTVAKKFENVKWVFTNGAHDAVTILTHDNYLYKYGPEINGGSVYTFPEYVTYNVRTVIGTMRSMCALKYDGTVEIWGQNAYGVYPLPYNLTSIVAVYSTCDGYAARKKDGSVVSWGK